MVQKSAEANTHRALKQDEVKKVTAELLEEVLSSDNLTQAWKRVKANKGAPGIDGMTIEDFPDHARAHWAAVRQQIKEGRYQPQAFSDSSFGFRPGRNAHQAIRRVQRHVKDGNSIAVDIDLAKFFDTVNHDVLMSLLGKTIADKRLLRLIGRYLRAGVLVGEHVEPSEVGTPQGGPLSPLLANILLHQLDLELERRSHRFAR